jgi:hypothetical protein
VPNEDIRSKRFLMVFEDVDMHKKRMLEELLPRLRHCKQGRKERSFTVPSNRYKPFIFVNLTACKNSYR